MRAFTHLSCVFELMLHSLHADRFTQHRYKADQAFLLNKDKAPVAAYLDIDYIVKICRDNGVEGKLGVLYCEVSIA